MENNRIAYISFFCGYPFGVPLLQRRSFVAKIYVVSKGRSGGKGFIIKIPTKIAKELGLSKHEEVLVTITKISNSAS